MEEKEGCSFVKETGVFSWRLFNKKTAVMPQNGSYNKILFFYLQVPRNTN